MRAIVVMLVAAIAGCQGKNESDLEGVASRDRNRAMGFVIAYNAADFLGAYSDTQNAGIRAFTSMMRVPQIILAECRSNDETAEKKLLKLEDYGGNWQTTSKSIIIDYGVAEQDDSRPLRLLDMKGDKRQFSDIDCFFVGESTTSMAMMESLSARVRILFGNLADFSQKSQEEKALITAEYFAAQAIFLGLRGSANKAGGASTLFFEHYTRMFEMTEGSQAATSMGGFEVKLPFFDDAFNPCTETLQWPAVLPVSDEVRKVMAGLRQQNYECSAVPGQSDWYNYVLMGDGAAQTHCPSSQADLIAMVGDRKGALSYDQMKQFLSCYTSSLHQDTYGPLFKKIASEQPQDMVFAELWQTLTANNRGLFTREGAVDFSKADQRSIAACLAGHPKCWESGDFFVTHFSRDPDWYLPSVIKAAVPWDFFGAEGEGAALTTQRLEERDRQPCAAFGKCPSDLLSFVPWTVDHAKWGWKSEGEDTAAELSLYKVTPPVNREMGNSRGYNWRDGNEAYQGQYAGIHNNTPIIAFRGDLKTPESKETYERMMKNFRKKQDANGAVARLNQPRVVSWSDYEKYVVGNAKLGELPALSGNPTEPESRGEPTLGYSQVKTPMVHVKTPFNGPIVANPTEIPFTRVKTPINPELTRLQNNLEGVEAQIGRAQARLRHIDDGIAHHTRSYPPDFGDAQFGWKEYFTGQDGANLGAFEWLGDYFGRRSLNRQQKAHLHDLQLKRQQMQAQISYLEGDPRHSGRQPHVRQYAGARYSGNGHGAGTPRATAGGWPSVFNWFNR